MGAAANGTACELTASTVRARAEYALRTISHPGTGFYWSPERTKPDVPAVCVGHAESLNRQRTLAMKHPMKMMWVCVAVIGLVAILAANGSGPPSGRSSATTAASPVSPDRATARWGHF